MVSIYRDLHTKVHRCLLKIRGSNVDERNLDKDLDIKLGRSQISTFTKLIVLLVLYYIIVIIHRPTKYTIPRTTDRRDISKVKVTERSKVHVELILLE